MNSKLREIRRLVGVGYIILLGPAFLLIFCLYIQELKKNQGGLSLTFNRRNRERLKIGIR